MESRREEGKTACLKPSVAASLVQYANLKPNSVVLDCMSGVGTIPIEVSELGRHVEFGRRSMDVAVRGVTSREYRYSNTTRTQVPQDKTFCTINLGC